MPEEPKRPLKVFLSYASQDKPVVRELSARLAGEGWIDPWVDEKKLLPGEDWRTKIEEAVETSDVVFVCLSDNSVTKEGFVQKELRYAREIAFEKPDETIFLIPLRLDDCTVPRGLRFYQWGDYFGEKKEETYEALLESLKLRHEQKLKLEAREHAQREKAEQERKVAEEKAYREAEERVRIEKQEQERKATEIATQEKEQREIAEKARREKKERETAEKIAKQQTRLDATEQAKRERVEHRTAQVDALKQSISKFLASSKSNIVKEFPRLRVVGFAGIAIALFWIGWKNNPNLSWIVPTAKASLTSTLRPSATFTISPQPPTKTLTPKSISTKTRTPVPTPLPIEITDTKAVSMVLVPGGQFIMGSDRQSDEQPVHEVNLPSFYMDIYEVTYGHYKECVLSNACKPTQKAISDAYSNHPVIYVDWDQAKTYCEWRGARLPTEAEWEKAARGTDGQSYPWGEEVVDGNYVNFCDNNCLADWKIPHSDDGYAGTAPVGIYPNGKSPYGIYDLAGNVWEWVADWYSATYYQNSPVSNPLGPDSGEYRVIRGASWLNIHFAGEIDSSNRGRLTPGSMTNDLGFRCARDGTP